jgi:hypothetical protein
MIDMNGSLQELLHSVWDGIRPWRAGKLADAPRV